MLDTAKIANDLEILVKKSENLTNEQKKHFISDVAKVLGATRHGSLSQYVTVTARNGEIVTIRLSNHNATVSTFDNREENNGISIVISRGKNNGVTNDGDAHVVEFFYPDKTLRHADGKPYAAIVRSIQQSLYSGEYKDTTGLAKAQEVNPPMFFRTKSGDVYGFAYDGKIYIDPRIVDSAETPIHEYTHLWAQAIRQSSQKKWAAIVKLMKGQKELWKEISDQYSDLTSDDDIAEEALAMFSGRRGNERLIQQAERAFSNPSLARRAVDAVRNAVRDFWRATAEKLGIPFTSAEHIADKALKDLIAFRNPNDVKNLKDLKDLNRNDPLATAARIAEERRQEKLRQRTKQEIGASGKTFEEIKDGTPEQRQVMFAMVPQYNDVIGQQQRIIYETQIGGKGAPWKEAHFDFLRPLRALQEALTGKAKEVLDAHNVYDKMKTLRSVIGQQQIRLRDNQVKAFYDAVSLYVKEGTRTWGGRMHTSSSRSSSTPCRVSRETGYCSYVTSSTSRETSRLPCMSSPNGRTQNTRDYQGALTGMR